MASEQDDDRDHSQIDIEPEEKELEEEQNTPLHLLSPRPLTFGTWNWMFGVVAELTKPSTFDPPPPIPNNTGLAVPNSPPLWNNQEKRRNTLTSRLVIPQTQTTRPSPTLSTATFQCDVPQYADG
jgi:hypothetical protein